ncbi:glycoside hydrolase family 3 domain protein [Cordyceps javanica]|nr:glycoside hydrolase family 3 domain protein [Cordyceps javanica]
MHGHRLDLKMPGPDRRRGKNLLDAYAKGMVDMKYIEEFATCLLKLIHKAGKEKYENWQEGEEQASDLPEHRALLRQAGAEGTPLSCLVDRRLGQAKTLPLKDLNGKKIAVVGPNAARSVASGGGSSNLVAHYPTTPYDSIKAEVANKFTNTQILTHAGVPAHCYLPLLDEGVMRNPETGERGFRLSLWRNFDI